MHGSADSRAVGSALIESARTDLQFRASALVGLLAIGLSVVVLAGANVGTVPAGARLAGVVVPVAFALYRLGNARSDRFALLLVAAGSMWSLTILAESHSSTMYSIGRLSVWIVEPVLVFLILSFPTGRLTTAGQRRIAGAAVVLVAVLYVPSAFLGALPTPSPWTDCGTSCPSNALQLSDSTSAFAADVLQPTRELLAVVLFALVTLEVIRRSRSHGAILRRILAPVAAVAMLRAVALPVYLAARSGGHTSAAVDALGWMYVLSLPAITLAFAAGLLAHRLFVADALERLTLTLTSRPSAGALRDTLAGALRDPDLEIRFFVPESPSGWIEAMGWPAAPPSPGPAQAITEVSGDGRILAAIVHDRVLSEDRALLAAVSSYTVTALENQQLVGQLQSSLEELTESRARLVMAADQQRLKIERDLHDGAQQRLVALQINLTLLADEVAVDSPASAEHLRALEDHVEATLDEVRRFGRGLYPPLLADRGLSDALHAVARTAPIPTTIDARLPHRYPREAESAVYFACLEALQNASKHAHEATNVRIALSGNGALRFDVRDDGSGFDPASTAHGVGLTHMRDRIGAVGGELWISSQPNGGTHVSGIVPVAPARAASAPPARRRA